MLALDAAQAIRVQELTALAERGEVQHVASPLGDHALQRRVEREQGAHLAAQAAAEALPATAQRVALCEDVIEEAVGKREINLGHRPRTRARRFNGGARVYHGGLRRTRACGLIYRPSEWSQSGMGVKSMSRRLMFGAAVLAAALY